MCFGCGEPGHIRPKCPNKVRRVNPREGMAEMLVDGALAGSLVLIAQLLEKILCP